MQDSVHLSSFVVENDVDIVKTFVVTSLNYTRIANLLPGTEYKITVLTFTTTRQSEPSSVVAKTGKD